MQNVYLQQDSVYVLETIGVAVRETPARAALFAAQMELVGSVGHCGVAELGRGPHDEHLGWLVAERNVHLFRSYCTSRRCEERINHADNAGQQHLISLHLFLPRVLALQTTLV